MIRTELSIFINIFGAKRSGFCFIKRGIIIENCKYFPTFRKYKCCSRTLELRSCHFVSAKLGKFTFRGTVEVEYLTREMAAVTVPIDLTCSRIEEGNEQPGQRISTVLVSASVIYLYGRSITIVSDIKGKNRIAIDNRTVYNQSSECH